MASPWGKVAAVEPVDFKEIMSEQVARDLQAKEDRLYAEMMGSKEKPPPEEFQLAEDSCENDELIAQTLQKQFDKIHDHELKFTQQKYNGNSKVSVSFVKYYRAGDEEDSDPEEDEIVDIRDRKDWDRFDSMQRQVDSIPPKGYKIENGHIITKHDVTINGRKNACKMLSFPPDFQTGDGEDMDLKINNNVFNHLKRHSQREEARGHRVKDPKKDKSTAELGFDEPTKLIIFKMTDNGLLDGTDGIISTGKEALIVYTTINPEFFIDRTVSKEAVLKVFKTTLTDFKHRDQYINDDFRFKDRIGKQHTKKCIKLWAEKEMHNLNRLKNANIPCPEVLALKDHVLLMSFIGRDGEPARKLKHAAMDRADYIIAYDQIVENMKRLFNDAELIHGDLSEYNILWFDGRCYFIDVAQSVMPMHEEAFFFLRRDCENISRFFSKKNVPQVESADELFKSITGYYFEEKEELSKLREKIKMKPHLIDEMASMSQYNFDEAWNRSKTESIVEALSA